MTTKSNNSNHEPVAHIRESEGEFIPHLLSDHLKGVATLASRFASKFGNADWAGIAGLWHDLGKYQEGFQKYIRSQSGCDGHIENAPGRVDHSTAGAIYSKKQLGPKGRILAYLIAGHHAGLPDWSSPEEGRASLEARLQNETTLDLSLLQKPPTSILESRVPTSKPPGGDPALWIRMLFSCLVDADFLDTELFMSPQEASRRQGGSDSCQAEALVYSTIAELNAVFDKHMKHLLVTAKDTAVNRVRRQILEDCKNRAAGAPGIYSLTVPTGGGKTLSSMAFALNHAQLNGKDRIIYVIPYTSIIEQTAEIFRNIFGDNVVEHHSNIDPEKETPKSRLASENWDAPIVVTTSVQFFESLFSARSSRCRKLHNIVNSVVVLDEAQLLPPDFLKPILQALQTLVDYYKLSLVISTATQPALQDRHSFDAPFRGLRSIEEIIPKPSDLHTSLKRVQVQIPKDMECQESWDDIAQQLSQHESVLCVVPTRRAARELMHKMPMDTIHLSAAMCGEHRSQVIRRIKDSLLADRPTRVISTSLVEAGVDLDFPVVYRAIAGVDSIAQAAGRCNREGILPNGWVKVFVPPELPPKGIMRLSAGLGKQLLDSHREDPLAPEVFRSFFEQLYWLKGDNLDKHSILEDLKYDGEMRFMFRTAAANFKLIDEAAQASVIVRFGNEDLIGSLRKNGPERWLMRKLQRYIVNIPRYSFFKLLQRGDLEEVYCGIYIQAHDALYDPQLGLLDEYESCLNPEVFMV